MFTRCPECQKTQPLTLEQLRASRGMLRCIQCSALFDALMTISETEVNDNAQLNPVKPLPWDKKKQLGNLYWCIGLIFSLLMLVAQLVYFEGYALSQKQGFRLWVEKICAQLNCNLPVYQNIDEFEVLHRSLTLLPDQNYAFNIVFSNQAAFRQKYPNIKLTLLNFSGQAFAHRIFFPADYLSNAFSIGAIEADATTEINLKIVAPKTKVGGFDFDFQY